jgi:predicted metal-dependent hydrolase
MESRLVRRALRPLPPVEWRLGAPVWYRGVPTPVVRAADGPHLVLGDLCIPPTPPHEHDLRPRIERTLRRLAEAELPARAGELAAIHDLSPSSIHVRNQRSRWGSCSARGRISLNWRLVQVPPEIRDYIILHELAHLRHLNHSRRFWEEVRRLCPAFESAEAWIKAHGSQFL